MDQLAPYGSEADGGVVGCRCVSERGTLSLPEETWAEAHRQAAVIGPLATRVSVTAIAAAGQALGLSEQTVYALVRRWRQSGSLAASLTLRPSPEGCGTGQLSAAERTVAGQSVTST